MNPRTTPSPARPAILALAAAALAAAALVAPAGAGEIAVEGQAGYFQMTAENSASAVFGSRGGGTFGAAARYTFGPGIFVSAGFRRVSRDGERVFGASPSDPVFKLGFPLTVDVNPVFFDAGWRFRPGRLLVPYAGIGLNRTSYKEASAVAGQPYSDSRTKTGFEILFGVEVGRGFLRLGGEATWSTVSDVVGLGGVTQVYNENNLGGWTYVGKVVLAFHL
jgi:opacity protein-like surface antigen